GLMGTLVAVVVTIGPPLQIWMIQLKRRPAACRRGCQTCLVALALLRGECQHETVCKCAVTVNTNRAAGQMACDRDHRGIAASARPGTAVRAAPAPGCRGGPHRVPRRARRGHRPVTS